MMMKIIAPVLALAAIVQGATVPQYQPPTANDVRSPCPMLNALANHGILPRDGKNIPPKDYVEALKQVSCAPDFCGALAYGGSPIRFLLSYILMDLLTVFGFLTRFHRLGSYATKRQERNRLWLGRSSQAPGYRARWQFDPQ